MVYLRYTVAALVLLVGGWFVFTIGVGSNVTIAAPIAVQADKSNSVALTRLAEQRASDDLPVAEDLALRAIAIEPLNARAMLIVGLAAVADRNIAAADKIFAKATTISRRTPVAQAWMFDLDMTNGRYASALDHADALLRNKSAAGAKLIPVLVQISSYPQALPALAQHLAEAPPWRFDFFRRFSRDHEEGNLPNLLEALAKAGTKPDKAEAGLLAAREVELNDAFGARDLWQRTMGRPLPPIVDGGFDDRTAFGPFGWSFPSGGGEVVRRDTDRGSLLRIDEQAARPRRPIVEQSLILSPGSYTLALETRGEGETIKIDIRCRITNASLARLSPTSSANWHPATTRFVVPGEGCPIQRLIIASSGGNAQLDIDTLTIHPAG